MVIKSLKWLFTIVVLPSLIRLLREKILSAILAGVLYSFAIYLERQCMG
jgi:hypothetical protein